MKGSIIRLLLPVCVWVFPGIIRAQSDWPKVITATDGTIINIYQPQTESFAREDKFGRKISSGRAISQEEDLAAAELDLGAERDSAEAPHILAEEVHTLAADANRKACS